MKIKTKTSITKRKKEEKLKDSEERFRTLFETAVDPILILDKKGRFVLINYKVTELTDFTKKDLIGKHFMKTKVLTPKSKLICLKNFTKRMLGKDIPPYEIEALTKKGDIIPVEINANPIREKGEIVGDLVILRDITKRKKTEERLRLLSSAVEQSSEGIAVSELKGNLLFVNDAFAVMHGYTPEKLVGKHLSIFHTPEQMPSVEAANREIQKTGKFNGEIWHVRRNGTVFPTLMHNSLLRDEAGNPIGMIGTLRDITKRKKLEKERQESNKRLQRIAQKLTIARDELKVAIETKGEFMNIAAHELKTPLQPIIGYADRLLRSGKLTRWQKKRLTIILDNAKNLLKLVQDVLDINKMETGIMKFSMKETDLLKIVKDVYESFKPTVEAKKLKFILDISDTQGPIKIKGDPNRLNQVFFNLIDNAVKFTDKGAITVQVKEGKETVTVNIKDTGIGIAKSYMPKMFTKFFQVDGSDKRKERGTGLGLTICKEIVKAHKGKINTQSTLGKGSTFQVVLPKLTRSS